MKTILIVEDTREELKYAVECVKASRENYNILTAGTLSETLGVLQNNKVDFIFSDVFYPLGDIAEAKEIKRALGSLYKDFVEPHFKYGLGYTRHDIKDYCLGIENSDEVPAGIVLFFKAILRDVFPIMISSHKHHSAKGDILLCVIRAIADIADDHELDPRYNESFFLEEVNDETSHKYWEKALDIIIDEPTEEILKNTKKVLQAIMAKKGYNHKTWSNNLQREVEHWIDLGNSLTLF